MEISRWKSQHPQEFKQLGVLGKRILDFIKPGPNGTLESSELVQDYKILKSSGLEKVLIYPILFAAGAISMGHVLGVFDSVRSYLLVKSE